MKKVINRRLIGDGYSYSLLARLQNFKRFPALVITHLDIEIETASEMHVAPCVFSMAESVVYL